MRDTHSLLPSPLLQDTVFTVVSAKYFSRICNKYFSCENIFVFSIGCVGFRRKYFVVLYVHTTFDSPGTGSRFHVYTLAPARSADTAASDWSSDAMLRRL